MECNIAMSNIFQFNISNITGHWLFDWSYCCICYVYYLQCCHGWSKISEVWNFLSFGKVYFLHFFLQWLLFFLASFFYCLFRNNVFSWTQFFVLDNSSCPLLYCWANNAASKRWKAIFSCQSWMDPSSYGCVSETHF
jgi:hypothetical protein